MSRLALDPKAGDDWTRLYVYAFSVIEALDEKPFPADRRMDPASPDVQRRLRDFAAWLEPHRRDLEHAGRRAEAGDRRGRAAPRANHDLPRRIATDCTDRTDPKPM